MPIWIDKGAFKLPAPEVPLICVGPGTGIAPLRSFLHERAALAASGVKIAPSVLFFGCRNKDKDWIYSDEMQELQRCGVLHAERGNQTAFSRDQERKVYVQQRIDECAAWLWPMIAEDSACVFVSGSANKMPAAVAVAFEQAIAQGAACDALAAKRLLAQLSRAGRYNVEAWS